MMLDERRATFLGQSQRVSTAQSSRALLAPILAPFRARESLSRYASSGEERALSGRAKGHWGEDPQNPENPIKESPVRLDNGGRPPLGDGGLSC